MCVCAVEDAFFIPIWHTQIHTQKGLDICVRAKWAKILSGVIYDTIKANKQSHFIRTPFLHGEYRLNAVLSMFTAQCMWGCLGILHNAHHVWDGSVLCIYCVCNLFGNLRCLHILPTSSSLLWLFELWTDAHTGTEAMMMTVVTGNCSVAAAATAVTTTMNRSFGVINYFTCI